MQNRSRCPHVEAIARAGGGPLPPELARHAAACPDCADARLVDGMLRAAAAGLVPRHLPDAAAVYRRAGRRERAARTERALRPIAWLNRLGLAAGGVALVGLVLGKGAAVAAWLGALGRAAAAALGSGLHAAMALGAAPHTAVAGAAAPPTIAASGAPAAPASLAAVTVLLLLLALPLLTNLYLGWVDE